MKAIITIFQCKRVVLPYIFIKYCYPRMKAIFPGEMKVCLIQHVGNVEGQTHLAGHKTGNISNSMLNLVQKWTEEGKYAGASIIKHSENVPKYPSLPSLRIGVEIALKEKADFHVWLEDDALVFDEECHRWKELIGNKDVGVYSDWDHIHVAYLVSRPPFDKRLLPIMQKEELWDMSIGYVDKRGVWHPDPGSIEYFTTQACKTERGKLKKDYAVRIHEGLDPKKVVEIVNKVAPNEVALLKIDFGKLVPHARYSRYAIEKSLLIPIHSDTFFAIDTVNGVKVSQLTSSIVVHLNRQETVTIIGWAVDRQANDRASAVFITIDGKDEIPTLYGLDRPDVADHFKNTHFRFSGYIASFSSSILTEGEHSISLKIVSKDGAHYYHPETKLTLIVN